MSMHRLLQRGFAKLYGYKLPEPSTSSVTLAGPRREFPCIERVHQQDESDVLFAENMKDLHFKMRGVRFLVRFTL